jgi:hypothetical protein
VTPQPPPSAPVNSRRSLDFSNLPPSIAESLAKLAGRPAVPGANEEPSIVTAPDGKPSEG